MTVDVSAAKAKERAARFPASFDPGPPCGRAMEMRQHPPGWQPKPSQPFYFVAWDYCRPCGHTQHYERYKRYVEQPAERHADDIVMSTLDDMARADKVPPDRVIPERFTGTAQPTWAPWEDPPEPSDDTPVK